METWKCYLLSFIIVDALLSNWTDRIIPFSAWHAWHFLRWTNQTSKMMEHTLLVLLIDIHGIIDPACFVMISILVRWNSTFQLVVKKRICFFFLDVPTTVHVWAWFIEDQTILICSFGVATWVIDTKLLASFGETIISVGFTVCSLAAADAILVEAIVIIRFRSRPALDFYFWLTTWLNDLYDFIIDSLLIISFVVKNSSLINGDDFLLTLTVLSDVVFSFFESQDAQIIKYCKTIKNCIVNW